MRQTFSLHLRKLLQRLGFGLGTGTLAAFTAVHGAVRDLGGGQGHQAQQGDPQQQLHPGEWSYSVF